MNAPPPPRRWALVLGLVFIAIGVTLILLGCGPSIEAGKVTGREYDDPDTWWSTQCMSYNAKGYCTFQMPVQHHDEDHYFLKIEDYVDGKLVRDKIEVTQHEYQTCKVGWRYPECEPR